MPKRIRVTDELIGQFINVFQKERFLGGKVNFNCSLPVDSKQKAQIAIREEAYLKMLSLVNGFDHEVAWHGIVDRIDKNIFYLVDIVVPPQKVTSFDVTTDDEKYRDWLDELDNKSFNRLRLQGHSHVRMDVSPSATDLEHQKKILSQMEDDMFYIFVILNQKGQANCMVYDLENNLFYDNSEVEVVIESEYSISEFLAEAGKLVQKQTVSYKPVNKKTAVKKDKKIPDSTILPFEEGNGCYYPGMY